MGAELVIALLPGSSYINHPESLSARYQEYLRNQVVAGLGERPDINVIDLATAMRMAANKTSQPWYFPSEGHLTPQGHQYVALLISEKLQGYSLATEVPQ